MILLKTTGLAVAAAFAMLAWIGEAGATLTVLNTYTGNELVSTDGCGTTGPSCNLMSNIQAGSTIQAAFLYSSTHSLAVPPVLPNPNGITLSQGAATTTPLFIPLGVNAGFLQAWRADVTSFVQDNAKAVVGSLATWTVTEGALTSVLNGEALVIVYSNPTAQPGTHTIAILDGFAPVTGDTVKIAFTALPVGFTAHMFLGDGFSFDGPDPKAPDDISQTSTITVNGIPLTSVAGHCDDAQDASCGDSNLFTMGGSNAGPKTDAFTPPACSGLTCVGSDHEAYDLGNIFKVGDTGATLTTINNILLDDNIFLEIFDLSVTSEIIPPSPPGVPEPGTLLLLGAGLIVLAGLRRVLKHRP
jgi:hypothetical protein